ncbi:MAG TPA: HAMP domain-containing sensor histidine kinase [Solirubrobacteraceae bacterium]|nr:HAMP domain-containing sensor histidine kinase [Solirubrobacteraceae bacterium]
MARREGVRGLLGRLVPASLRWRLAVWVTVVMGVCVAMMFVAVYRGTGSELHRQIDRELGGDATEFGHQLRASGARTPAGVWRAAKGYVANQPFRASSTLLFALVAGAGTATNRPELFGSALPDNGETAGEQARENRLSGRLVGTPLGYSTVGLPDVGNLRLLKRSVRLPGGARATVGVGEPLGSVASAQRGVARAFVLAGILALVGALVGAYAIGTRVSGPLRRMAGVAARVDAGDLEPRLEGAGGESEEVRVLTDAFNHMLDRLTDAFAGQRAFVADASHELRTPLTVMRGQLEVLAAQENPPREEIRRVEGLVQAELARIARLVDDLLLLAKAEQTRFLRLEAIGLRGFVGELWDGASLVAERRFELGPVAEGTLRADPDRLAQALRNLIANGVAHSEAGRGLVRLSVEGLEGGWVRFVVEDDGPGIPVGQRERIFDRFHRTDAARDRASGGTGLGLAIVKAIVDAHGGRVRAGRSREGGARIELELPGFAAAAVGEASGAVPPRPYTRLS